MPISTRLSCGRVPFLPMLRDGIAERRRRVDDPAVAGEAPMFEELHAAGMTEWLGRVFPFGELMPKIGSSREAEHADRLFLVCSLTTDRPGGYLEFDMAVLKQVLPLFALAAKAVTMRAIGQGLLAAYLGDDPAAASCRHGAARRGAERRRHRVLHRPARLHRAGRRHARQGTDRPARRLLRMHGGAGREARRRGAEIHGRRSARGLRRPPATRAEACSAALDAATEALALIDGLNERRRAAGRQAIELDISLHLGTVQYGNVGTAQRLDFTVIGPAVNEASRIEKLCEPLGAPPDLPVLRRSGDLLAGPPGLARPPPPARRTRGGRAVRADAVARGLPRWERGTPVPLMVFQPCAQKSGSGEPRSQQVRYQSGTTALHRIFFLSTKRK